MKYISTRGLAPALTFEEAMLTGLALDGGLYVPEYIPKVTKNQILSLQGLRYQEIAFEITKPFMGNAFEDDELHEIIEKAYADFSHISCAPLVELEANHFLLELFHGPTLAFKDFAMQLIGQLFQVALKSRGKRVTIIGATSGDTGSAAIEAFKGLDAVDVFILFPDGREFCRVCCCQCNHRHSMITKVVCNLNTNCCMWAKQLCRSTQNALNSIRRFNFSSHTR